jgi:hypothetical protein
MAEVTYYVALPFIARDDGVAAGEPTECYNPNAAVMRAEEPSPLAFSSRILATRQAACATIPRS